MKPRHAYCEVFKMNFYFCIGWGPDQFAKYMQKNFNHDPKMKLAEGKTIMVENDKGRITIIWIKDRTDFPVLAHECIHAANFTLDVIGHIYDYENDEVMAYLTTWIIKKAMKKI